MDDMVEVCKLAAEAGAVLPSFMIGQRVEYIARSSDDQIAGLLAAHREHGYACPESFGRGQRVVIREYKWPWYRMPRVLLVGRSGWYYENDFIAVSPSPFPGRRLRRIDTAAS